MKKRTRTLGVRFSDDEWEKLQSLSQEAGVPMSKLVRDHLGKVRIRNSKDEKERIAMLNRINANLNMIARWVNTYKGTAESVQVISNLIAIQRSIDEIAS